MGPARRSAATDGFTLVEIVVALIIVALIVAAVIPLDSAYQREGEMREPARELIVLAKTARADAIRFAQPTAVFFSTNGLALQRAGETEPQAAYTFPQGMQCELRPWEAAKWIRPTNEVAWVFQPSGICEPITVRFTKGDAFFEVQIDPLTAGVAEESYSIP